MFSESHIFKLKRTIFAKEGNPRQEWTFCILFALFALVRDWVIEDV